MPLSEQDELTLLSLPYIVGIWVSHAEDEEGDYDDEMEMKALERILIAYAHEKELPPAVHGLVLQTISSKDQWMSWAEEAFNPLPRCEKAIEVVKATHGKVEAKSYARMLLDVGEAVAMAYGEFGMDDDDDHENVLKRFMTKFSAKLRGEDAGHDEGGLANISATEQAALDKLETALSWQELKAA